MSHPAQIQFVRSVKRHHRPFFVGVNVVDVGSLDINGNNRRHFWWCNYIGIDIVEGRNVDIVAPAHEALMKINGFLDPKLGKLSTIISTEALEHDKYWQLTLSSMYTVLEPGGLMIITAGGDGREEHGTHTHEAWCSPGTNDYYKNISNEMFSETLPAKDFTTYHIAQHNKDFQFYGIKKQG